MKLVQIANILNNVMIPNQFADNSDTTIAEDLRNVVELGTAISALSKNEFLDYSQKIAVGVVRTYFDGRQIGLTTYGLEMDGEEYGGVTQRVKGKLIEMQDSAALNPVSIRDDNSAPSYLDGHYYGIDFDVRIFETTTTAKIVHSTSETKFKKMFNDRQAVIDWFGFVESIVQTSLENSMNQLAKSVIRKMMLVANNGSRRINLIPLYNTVMNYSSGMAGYVTLADWKNSEAFSEAGYRVVYRYTKPDPEPETRVDDPSKDVTNYDPEPVDKGTGMITGEDPEPETKTTRTRKSTK